MKKIVAVIKPFKIDEVKNALNDIHIEGMTVTESRGFGRQKGHSELYRRAEYSVDFNPKLKVEIITTDEAAFRVVEAIRGSASADKIGDGKIFVLSVEEAMRIRTGEEGDNAL